MNLTIDIGNTTAKAALFDEEGRLVRLVESGKWQAESFDKAILVSTRGEVPEIEAGVRERVRHFVKFDHTTPVPLKNLYATPETLGYDRLAAAVGAHSLYPAKTVLVADFGTAVTFDVVTAAGEFLGGNISPGAAMRFRALHDYTGTLPMAGLPPVKTGGKGTAGFSSRREFLTAGTEFPARDTKTALQSGVVAGMVAETEYYIEAAKVKFGEVGIIFTGGDADYFAELVKFPIFAVSDLVFHGLNAILEYNGASRTGFFFDDIYEK